MPKSHKYFIFLIMQQILSNGIEQHINVYLWDRTVHFTLCLGDLAHTVQMACVRTLKSLMRIHRFCSEEALITITLHCKYNQHGFVSIIPLSWALPGNLSNVPQHHWHVCVCAVYILCLRRCSLSFIYFVNVVPPHKNTSK